MSDTDGKKPLGLGGGARGPGQVKQSFSHGRTKSVAVEVKRKRVVVPTKPGEVPQSTEAAIGPYNLQDFTLFHVLRRGCRPSRIAFLAEKAWGDATTGSWPPGFPEDKRVAYSLEEIVGWERLFLRRFFSNQFKRSAIPNGPKVMAGGSLSPRGDWRMPSDASGAAWIAELEGAVAGVARSGVPASTTHEGVAGRPEGGAA